MRTILRGACLIALTVILAGCKMTLTNRVDLHADGSALVHVVIAVDEQLYSMAQSQSKGTDPFDSPNTRPGWETQRRLDANGDHVIEATKRVGTFSEIGPALASFYADATSKSRTSAHAVPGLSAASWKVAIDEKSGLFTRTVHLHATVPPLIPDTPSSKPDSAQQAGEQLARAMMASMITLHSEISAPGRIVSTNGEKLPDGSIRFTHPLGAASAIDVVDELPNFQHAVVVAVIALIVIAVVVVVVTRTLRRGVSARRG